MRSALLGALRIKRYSACQMHLPTTMSTMEACHGRDRLELGGRKAEQFSSTHTCGCTKQLLASGVLSQKKEVFVLLLFVSELSGALPS